MLVRVYFFSFQLKPSVSPRLLTPHICSQQSVPPVFYTVRNVINLLVFFSRHSRSVWQGQRCWILRQPDCLGVCLGVCVCLSLPHFFFYLSVSFDLHHEGYVLQFTSCFEALIIDDAIIKYTVHHLLPACLVETIMLCLWKKWDFSDQFWMSWPIWQCQAGLSQTRSKSELI